MTHLPAGRKGLHIDYIEKTTTLESL